MRGIRGTGARSKQRRTRSRRREVMKTNAEKSCQQQAARKTTLRTHLYLRREPRLHLGLLGLLHGRMTPVARPPRAGAPSAANLTPPSLALRLQGSHLRSSGATTTTRAFDLHPSIMCSRVWMYFYCCNGACASARPGRQAGRLLLRAWPPFSVVFSAISVRPEDGGCGRPTTSSGSTNKFASVPSAWRSSALPSCASAPPGSSPATLGASSPGVGVVGGGCVSGGVDRVVAEGEAQSARADIIKKEPERKQVAPTDSFSSPARYADQQLRGELAVTAQLAHLDNPIIADQSLAHEEPAAPAPPAHLNNPMLRIEQNRSNEKNQGYGCMQSRPGTPAIRTNARTCHCMRSPSRRMRASLR